MRVLLDSNILLRLSQPGHPHAKVTAKAVDLLQRRHRCVVVPQTIYEYWVVATRPIAANGLGFSCASAREEASQFLELFPMLDDESGLFEGWMQLVDACRVTGVRAHDARYVAAMKRHGVARLLTFNVRDFRRFSEVQAVSPLEVEQGWATGKDAQGGPTSS